MKLRPSLLAFGFVFGAFYLGVNKAGCIAGSSAATTRAMTGRSGIGMTGGGLVGVGGPAGRLRSAGFHCAQQLIRHQRHVRRLISLPLCLGQPTTP